MTMDRRTLLQGMVVLSTAALGLPARALTRSRDDVALVVYDGQHAPSRALARGATTAIDLVDERQSRWAALRAAQPESVVIGLTSWSDLIQVQAALEPRRKRLRTLESRGAFYYWEIA